MKLQDFLNKYGGSSSMLKQASDDDKKDDKDDKKEKEKENSKKEKAEDKKEKDEDKKKEDDKDDKKEKSASGNLQELYGRAVNVLPNQTLKDLDSIALVQALNIKKTASMQKEATSSADLLGSLLGKPSRAIQAVEEGLGAVGRKAEGILDEYVPISYHPFDKTLTDSQATSLGAGLTAVGTALGAGVAVGGYKLGKAGLEQIAKTKALKAQKLAEKAFQDEQAIKNTAEAVTSNFGDKPIQALKEKSNIFLNGANHIMNSANLMGQQALQWSKENKVPLAVGATAIAGTALGLNALSRKGDDSMRKQLSETDLFEAGYKTAIADVKEAMNKSASINERLEKTASIFVDNVFDSLLENNMAISAIEFEARAKGAI